MESTLPAAGVASEEPRESLSLIERAIAVFVRPTQAWVGLREHVQWWFPFLLIMLLTAVSTWFLHERAIAPMVLDQMEQQVADGQMPREQYESMEKFFGSTLGRTISVVQQAVIVIPILTLLTAVMVWFGVAFILGVPLRFRLALEAVSWASLITIPTQIIVFLMAWSRETMKGVHSGFGLLLPEADPPSKLMVGLGVFLDAIGPLSIWYLIVLVIGVSALSGAPRRSAAWVIGGLYIGLILLLAALAAVFTPAA